jgi:iron complex outermembrane receptor protein
MIKRKSLGLAIICALLSVNYALAAKPTQKDLGQVFNPEIFSLSKRKENAFDAPSATYVLSSEEIRRSGMNSIPEALRLVPGVQVARMGGNKWAIAIRGFNRQFSNKLLVMIDGRTVYTPLFSGAFWDIHDYVLADVDRIEVVRGPGGTIWGANAVNGVINIITKSAAQTQGGYVSQIIGSEDKSITEVRYGGENASGDNYRLYAKKVSRGGLDRYSSNIDNDDGVTQSRAGFRYDISSMKSNKLSISGDIFDGNAKNFFNTLSGGLKRDDKNSRGANVVVNWDRKLSSKSSFILNSYFDYDQFEIPVLKRTANTIDVDFQHFYSFSQDNQFSWGVGYREVSDDIDEHDTNGYIPIQYTNEKRRDQLVTAFIQDKFALISDELYLTIGSKFEHNDFTGFEYQPNARLAYYPDRKQTVWASVSRAVRTPTRSESDITLKDANSNRVLNQGSPTYESEIMTAYEAGYKIKPNTKLTFDATAFYNQYSKLRTLEIGQGNNVTAANLGKGNSYGLEFSGKWQVNEDWRLESSYEYLSLDLGLSAGSNDNQSILKNADNLQNSEGQSPQSQFKLKSFYNVTPKLEFDNILYYVGGLNRGNGNLNKGIPSYVRLDTRLGYFFTKNLDLSIGIQNLLDQRHSEFKAATYNQRTELGRTYYAKLVWQY